MRFIIFLGLLTIVRVKGQGQYDAPFVPPSHRSPLISEAYSEGACIAPEVASNIDPTWLMGQKTFFVPIGSQFGHRRSAETLLSRPPDSDSELASMCLSVEFTSVVNGFNLTTEGFDDREFRQSCSAVSPGRLTCLALGSSSGVNPAKTESTEEYVVSTDNRSYMMVVRCVNGFFRDYKLLTTRGTVSSGLLKTVLNVTRSLGFDDRRLQILSYDNCFQNRGGLSANLQIQRTRNPLDLSPFSAPFPQNQSPPRPFLDRRRQSHFGPFIQNIQNPPPAFGPFGQNPPFPDDFGHDQGDY